MDRLTARSSNTMTTPPDWPLPCTPPPSLVNVDKKNKRHCRLLPAGMVDLTMAEADGRRKKGGRKSERVSVYSSLDEMFEVVDELFEKLDDQDEEAPFHEGGNDSVETDMTEKNSEPAARPKMMMTMTAADIAALTERVAEKTPLADSSSSSSSSSSCSPSSSSRTPETATIPSSHKTSSRPLPTITLTTAAAATTTTPPSLHQSTTPAPLTSNPPSTSEITHARALSLRHTNRHPTTSTKTSVVIHKPQRKNKPTALAGYDAVAQYGHVAHQRSRLVRCVSAARRTKGAMAGAVRRVFG